MTVQTGESLWNHLNDITWSLADSETETRALGEPTWYSGFHFAVALVSNAPLELHLQHAMRMRGIEFENTFTWSISLKIDGVEMEKREFWWIPCMEIAHVSVWPGT